MKSMLLVSLALVAIAGADATLAQAPQRGGGPGPTPAPQAAAPIDLTGYWVAIVNEEWRWRMVTPAKGDYASVQGVMSAEGRAEADKWTPAMDGRCEAYGAGGLMRMPTRVHITWQDDQTLKVETDAGTQTRLFRFTGNPPAGTPRSLQGHSVASWEVAGGGGRGGGGGGGGARGGGRGGPRYGSLKVVTTNLTQGWLRKNGVPYSEGTTITEYYDRFKSTNGDEWFFVTTLVNDPKYLTQEFVTSSHFKKEADGSKWTPSSCKSS